MADKDGADTAQYKAFREAAQRAGCDSSGAAFRRALDRLIPVRGKPSTPEVP